MKIPLKLSTLVGGDLGRAAKLAEQMNKHNFGDHRNCFVRQLDEHCPAGGEILNSDHDVQVAIC
jgi:hypothetical protein